MKKKIIAVALCALMTVSIAGCSKELSNDYVTIKQYEGLEVAKVEKTETTDEIVEQTIEQQLSASPVTDDTAGKEVKSGDTVSIDYKGSVDGVEFQGGTASGASCELGAGGYVGANGEYKGFEEQIIGHKTGETFDIKVKFAADYQNTELADKVAVFNIKLNGFLNTPELTDAWVKENSEESKTVEEFKKEVKKQLEETNEETAKSTLQSEVMQALSEQVEVKKYPDGEVDEQVKSITDYYTQMATAYGVELKDLLEQYMQMSEEDFNKQAKEVAQNTVKTKLACELIAKKKNLEPTEKEYDKKIKEYAENSGYEDVSEFTKSVGEDVVKSSILQEKVIEYLADKCVQVEAKDTEKTSSDK